METIRQTQNGCNQNLKSGAAEPGREPIRRRLAEAHGGWVSAYALAQIAIEYKRPIWELRHRDGLLIENQVIVVKRKKRGFYRLVIDPSQPAPPLPIQGDEKQTAKTPRPIDVHPPQQEAKPAAGQLFGNEDLVPSRFVDFEMGGKR